MALRLVPLYTLAILCFLAAILWAMRAMWPLRGKYTQSKVGSISKYRKVVNGHEALLLELITTYRDAIRHNQDMNGMKLGEYMESVTISGAGLLFVTFAAVLMSIGVLRGDIHPNRGRAFGTVSTSTACGPMRKGHGLPLRVRI
jgi:hypothetical protein